jgi:hypothetical protein
MSTLPWDEASVLSADTQLRRRRSLWFWSLEGPLAP